MTAYRDATDDDIAFYAEHGWIVVADAIDTDDLVELQARCDHIIEHRDAMAYDWAWETGVQKDERPFKILQSSPSLFWPDLSEARYRKWAVGFASALVGRPLEFWYDQFLAKSPGHDAVTHWHQDEGYWGRNLDDLGITCWMPFHDVDATNGCMHFIDGGHHDGVLEHRQPDGIQSDLLRCDPDESRTVVCPIAYGSVTFHHSKTPHMTTGNHRPTWRKALTQHLKVVGTPGEGDHYPWKVYVDQFSGKRSVPESR